MPTTKTAISLDSELFERADSVANELNIPRSRLIAMALDQFIERHRNRQILAALDAAHTDGASQDGIDLAQARRRRHRAQVEGSW
jgi:antitoxin MazE6